ncbi:hypothetical protein DL93DRAFT_2232334 [Clavulina sp. PMI_390]|nr:hypothetical protein DL93DRAFT_2232334 [Clavulina sp. PMI_390]
MHRAILTAVIFLKVRVALAAPCPNPLVTRYVPSGNNEDSNNSSFNPILIPAIVFPIMITLSITLMCCFARRRNSPAAASSHRPLNNSQLRRQLRETRDYEARVTAMYNQRQTGNEADPLPPYQPPKDDQLPHTQTIPIDHQARTSASTTTIAVSRIALEPMAPPPVYQGYQWPTPSAR